MAWSTWVLYYEGGERLDGRNCTLFGVYQTFPSEIFGFCVTFVFFFFFYENIDSDKRFF